MIHNVDLFLKNVRLVSFTSMVFAMFKFLIAVCTAVKRYFLPNHYLFTILPIPAATVHTD